MLQPSGGRDETDETRLDFSRRSMMKATGAVGAASLLPFSATAAGAGVETPTVDDALDTAGGLQEVLVVFESNADVDRLRHLESAHDRPRDYHAFSVLPIGYTLLTGTQIDAIADWPEVRYVQANEQLEYHNEDSRETTGAGTVHEDLFYTGETVHAVVVDSGIDGDHPDHQQNLQHNYRFVDPLDRETTWVDAGPADTASLGHGTHVSGSIAGDGTASDGRYKGMAPDADITVYSTDAAAALLNVVGAYDHMLDQVRQGKTEVQIVSNSFGAGGGDDYNPNGALETATWVAFEMGILPVFSAGNSGPDSNTLGNYAEGPHVLSVAATDDEMNVTDFSSRGRTPDCGGEGAHYDRAAALSNLRDFFDSNLGDQPVVQEQSYSGTVGPGSSDAGVGESAYEQWTAPSDAGFVEMEVSWTPPGQDLDIFVHEGARDGPVVASGATLDNPERLSGAIDGGTQYFIEIVPFANVTASYTVDLVAREALPPGREPSGPYGIYRIGVGAPGELVMSTLAPDDPLQGYAAGLAGAPEEQDTEPFYGKVSGTSMSCPVTSGVAALVIDAYRQTHGEFPDPIEVINILEATARDAKPEHNPYTIGAGFIDAVAAVREAESKQKTKFKDVALAVDGEATDPVFSASGSRADDGSAFTAGQTNQVDVTVEEASSAAVVKDRIPFDWTVVAGDSHTVYTDDGARYIEFTEPASAGETRTYFIEAPDATRSYRFGPAQARPADGGAFIRLAGTDTNEVVGVDTS